MNFLLALALLTADPAVEIRQHVSYLADDARKGRDTGSQGMVESRQYVIAQLKAAGVDTEVQKVGSCQNVIGFIKGKQPEYIVVGAHLDHVGIDRRGRVVNGADDNASGSAIILELAKRLRKVKPEKSVVFVWFTAEERGLIGSRDFAARPYDGDFDSDNKLPTFMLNLDMVGHLKARMADEPGSEPDLDGLYEKYAFAKRVTSFGGGSGSDHVSFVRKGVPSIFLHTGVTSTYHTYKDDTDTLDYEGMFAIYNYAYDIIVLKAGISQDPPDDYILHDE